MSTASLPFQFSDATDALLQTSSAVAAAARDSLKTADLHHRFVQDTRKQAEAEYKAAFDAESEAAADMDRKRRHAEDTTAGHKRLCSDAFRALVKAKGGATCVFGALSSAASPSIRIICSLDANYDIEEGEVLSFSPTYNPHPPRPPRP